ncbi:DNA-binding protein [Vibrio ruber]|uniref:Uncharacterized protein n=1 Tax=Vibrio ruber (strain DSM 16370 / JCM 11486 / BCRC 17186 / CECT 7878 / LMG 23124 / VR1) TaxID=1123498 RepID=A0A1R4LQE2_VIBR1|nr:DNA-binding protein [Vibrio ruber]WNJ97451.1 DNA-binding protein [Vibrio ruber]SJN58735.1 hypothetical protein VR7878_03010 [Vibrio ruber DSM 16370]
MFALNGQTFGLKNLTVSFERELKSKDMSAQSSGTEQAEQGDKAATLNVSGLIAFHDIHKLEALQTMSSAKDDKGNRMVYTIVEEMANAFKIKKVRFSGRFSAAQQDNVMAWQVSFQLKESNSVAEQKEARQKAQTKAEPIQNPRFQQSLKQNKEAGR